VAGPYVDRAGGIIQLPSAAFPAEELANWALRLNPSSCCSSAFRSPWFSTNGTATTHLRRNVSFVDGTS